MNEWLEDGGNGLAVPSGDAAALASAVETLLGDPERAAAMGDAGRRRLATAFRAEDHVEGLLDLFTSCSRRRAA
jgi:glycosyltransferase involved in cell wall biosynthesis